MSSVPPFGPIVPTGVPELLLALLALLLAALLELLAVADAGEDVPPCRDAVAAVPVDCSEEVLVPVDEQAATMAAEAAATRSARR